jgi:hypothetical protein
MSETIDPLRTSIVQNAFPARRRFAKTLAPAAGNRSIPAHPSKLRSVPARLQDCRIASSHYHGLRQVPAHARARGDLKSHRQADKPCHERAIGVFCCTHKLGRLARLDNATAASFVNRGYLHHARGPAVHLPENTWEAVRLRAWTTTTPTRNRHGF